MSFFKKLFGKSETVVESPKKLSDSDTKDNSLGKTHVPKPVNDISAQTKEQQEKSKNKGDLSESETVQIGNQIWMKRNLDVDHFCNGDPIPEVRTDEEWKEAGKNEQPAWCYYENDPENGKIYGRLYNWFAVNDSRGLSPGGWHIPSIEEWTILVEFLGGKSMAGCKMISTETFWGDYSNATNESGFSGLPGGSRFYDGDYEESVGKDDLGFEFSAIGVIGYWWNSSEINLDTAMQQGMFFADHDMFGHPVVKSSGFSVRCLKQAEIDKVIKVNDDLSKEEESIRLLESHTVHELQEQLSRTVERHYNKFDPFRKNIVMSNIFKKTLDDYYINANEICKKILLCSQDNEMHSWSFADPNSEIQFETSIIPSSLETGQEYFAKQEPSGYLAFLNWLMVDYPFTKSAREKGVKVLVHFMVFVNKLKNRIEVHFSFIALGNPDDCPQPILPVELLSKDELNKLNNLK